MTDAEWDAWDELLDCQPTTLAGAIALTIYIAEFNFDPWDDGATANDALQAAAAALSHFSAGA
jgi:hypothetical protein